jgi:hypothetical protein
MSRFEFVLVLLSIIIGLGLTELLRNVVRQIRARKTVKIFWPQTILVGIMFFALMQIWWEIWGLHVVEVWSFPVLLLMLAGPITLFCTSHLIFPTKIEGANLEKYYFLNSRLIWGLASFTVIVSTLFRPLAFGANLFDPSNIASVFLLMIFIGLAITKNKMTHTLGTLIILGTLLLDILYFSLEI